MRQPIGVPFARIVGAVSVISVPDAIAIPVELVVIVLPLTSVTTMPAADVTIVLPLLSTTETPVAENRTYCWGALPNRPPT
jgi:hypothetical protein